MTRRRPQRAVVNFNGIDYEMDVTVCEHALVRRHVEGKFDSLASLADVVGVSRSTVSRFLSGRATSLTVALAILGKLELSFDEVFRRCDSGQDRAGTVAAPQS